MSQISVDMTWNVHENLILHDHRVIDLETQVRI